MRWTARSAIAHGYTNNRQLAGAKMNRKLYTVLAQAALAVAIVGVLAIGVHAEETPKDEPAAVQTAAQDEAPKPDTSDIFQEWLDNNHELGKGDTECLMCVGFGGGFRCGIGCDATGLTIHKPDGSTNAVCGRCVKGEWQ